SSIMRMPPVRACECRAGRGTAPSPPLACCVAAAGPVRGAPAAGGAPGPGGYLLLGRRRGSQLPCAVFSALQQPHVAAHAAPSAQPPFVPDLRLALAAAAAIPGPDPGAVRLRVPVRQGTLAPGPRRAEHGRAADHADRAGPDRRGDDLQPAGDGDRRRLRDLRLAPGPGRPPGPAG